MTKVFSEEERYDWDATQAKNPLAKKVEYERTAPHPVTVKCKVVLKKLIDMLELPANPLDQLTHLCGGRQNVAEMTGRKQIMEWMPDGRFRAVPRADNTPHSNLNLKVLCPPHCFLLCFSILLRCYFPFSLAGVDSHERTSS